MYSISIAWRNWRVERLVKKLQFHKDHYHRLEKERRDTEAEYFSGVPNRRKDDSAQYAYMRDIHKKKAKRIQAKLLKLGVRPAFPIR